MPQLWTVECSVVSFLLTIDIIGTLHEDAEQRGVLHEAGQTW